MRKVIPMQDLDIEECHLPTAGLDENLSPHPRTVLSEHELGLLDGYWRAANYLAVGQIYLRDNPMLWLPLSSGDIKPRLLGHWGTVPGLNMLYTHLNRVIRQRDTEILFVTGPGHGGPSLVAQTYLEGSYTELYPEVTQDVDGILALFRQFSTPGGVPSHCGPETPGSLHEGGELGYALSHAFGAVFDNPHLVATCVIGDGEAETGPLAAAWHSNKFLNPRTDGAVLPILHLNGFKIANPTIFGRMSTDELRSYFTGLSYEPYFVEGDDPVDVHQKLAATLDEVFDRIDQIQQLYRVEDIRDLPRWPVVVFRTPKGWTGPKFVHSQPAEGSWRSHQVPLKNPQIDAEELAQLEAWLHSYEPERLFEENGRLSRRFDEIIPRRARRMGLSPYANGGRRRQVLRLPKASDFACTVNEPGTEYVEGPRHLGRYLRDTLELNEGNPHFLLVGPDETASNRLGDVFDVTDRRWMQPITEEDDHLSPDGNVFEILSEHTCQGWLEGFLLTGRHGFFSCYEAFMPIVDSMTSQHAKWLKVANEVPWRHSIASLNVLLTSHVWRQDHNGFSHQDPGYVDHLLNKKSEFVRAYFPPDANCLLCVADECLKSQNRINVIVAGKQPEPQWLSFEDARVHCTAGAGIWEWAGTEGDGEPDVVVACCGDVPTMETLAAVTILREFVPKLSIRVVNVVDVACLQPKSVYRNGLSDDAFDLLFTENRPVIFAFHGYPGLIHRLIYRRTNHANFHVQGFQEEGSTTTPFDMLVRNDLDRFHLVAKVAEYTDIPNGLSARIRAAMHKKIVQHRSYVVEEGIDLPEVRDWKWSAADRRAEALR